MQRWSAAYAERLGHSGASASTTEFEGYVSGHRHVAVALVRAGVGGAIALAECDRAAARRRPQRGAIGLGGAAGLPGGSGGVRLASTSTLLAQRGRRTETRFWAISRGTRGCRSIHP